MSILSIKRLLFLLCAVALGGCSTASQQRVSAFMKTEAGKALMGIAESAANKAIDQIASSGKVNGREIAKDAISGASAELRKKQTPGTELKPAQAKDAAKVALTEGTGVPAVSSKISPVVAGAVADAVAKGHAADLVLEAAARGLDKAAASVK